MKVLQNKHVYLYLLTPTSFGHAGGARGEYKRSTYAGVFSLESEPASHSPHGRLCSHGLLRPKGCLAEIEPSETRTLQCAALCPG